jgi:hypothetical protein
LSKQNNNNKKPQQTFVYYDIFLFAILQKGEDGSEYEIQLNPTGISVYNNNLKTNSYFWPRIKRLDLKSNKLMLNVIDKTVF